MPIMLMKIATASSITKITAVCQLVYDGAFLDDLSRK